MISARPYRKSLASHIQQIGRIMRASPGKRFGLVLDHAGNFLRHAVATEEFWASGCDELDDGIRKPPEPREKSDEAQDRKCNQCGMVMEVKDEKCGNCGAERKRRAPVVKFAPGTMTEYNPNGGVSDLWPHIAAIAIGKHPLDENRARRFAMAQYKNLTGQWPPHRRTLGEAVESPHPGN